MPDIDPSKIKEQEQIIHSPTSNKKKNGKFLWRLGIFFAIFSITALAVFSSQVVVSEQSSSSWFGNLPFIKQIKHLAESADRSLKGDNNDRINILLLGMGGANHEGGLLTDTIMLASIEPSTKKVALVSIPRDLAVPVEDMGLLKINHINAYAEVKTKGSGGLAISQALSDILDLPIDYYVRVDFQGFINIVDRLGGLKIYVENTLSDYSYPVMGRETAEDYNSRYEHLYINEGWTDMDGQLALKYARSRHAAGAEGSDFARAKRQQKILAAAKNKVLSVNTLFKPKMVIDIIGEMKEHISTNFKAWEMLKFYDLLKNVNEENISSKVLDNSPNGLLTHTISEQGAYILVPQSGDFDEIKYFVNNIFSEAPPDSKAKVAKERATIEVRNGTWVNGLASQTALDLEKLGFIVVRVGNSGRQNFEKSVIYDLSFGEKNKSLTILKQKMNANITYEVPQWLSDDISRENSLEKNPIQPDFILIIGREADATNSGEINTTE